MLSILSELEIARLAMVWYLVQASQALQAVQAVQPMLHGESPPMMTPLQQVSHYCEIIQRVLSSIFRILLFPFRIQPSCHRWTLPRSLLLSSTAQFRLTLLSRYWTMDISIKHFMFNQEFGRTWLITYLILGVCLACWAWRCPCLPGTLALKLIASLFLHLHLQC